LAIHPQLITMRVGSSNSHSTFASNRRTLYKPKAGFSKARLFTF
jgi:hypothetical protein